MEDGLGEPVVPRYITVWGPFLILVLVEDGLGVPQEHAEKHEELKVLILVLVEDGLGVDWVWGYYGGIFES